MTQSHTAAKLSPAMDAAMRGVQVDHDGRLHIGWPNTFVRWSTRTALRQRGLTNENDQLTGMGEDWFNTNVDR